MIQIKKHELRGYYVSADTDDHVFLFRSKRAYLTIGGAWNYITSIMYQFNSNACLVLDSTKKRHAIYRLYENGEKEKLPIKVRNSDAITVKNNN